MAETADGHAGRPRAILVTGSHRSGTTWAGTLLSLSGEAFAIHEPFNPTDPRCWFADPAPRWFLHVDARRPSPWDAQLDRVLRLRPALRAMARRDPTPRNLVRIAEHGLRSARARRGGRRPLLKDPIAFFSAEWIAATFDVDVVVLIRHPAAFASSLKRLGWTFDFRNLTGQADLLNGLLRPFRTELLAATRRDLDIIDQANLLWRVINATALGYRERHPNWNVIRYEDMAADPWTGMQALYHDLGLQWSPLVAAGVSRYTGRDNVSEVASSDRGGVARHSQAAMWTWTQRLSADEVARIRSGTSDVADRLYSAEDWVAPAVGGRARAR